MYADRITGSMEYAITETARRREIQMAFNKEHGWVPKTIRKEIRDAIHGKETKEMSLKHLNKKGKQSKKEKEKLLQQLRDEMREAARVLDFERAAELRDIILEIEN